MNIKIYEYRNVSLYENFTECKHVPEYKNVSEYKNFTNIKNL